MVFVCVLFGKSARCERRSLLASNRIENSRSESVWHMAMRFRVTFAMYFLFSIYFLIADYEAVLCGFVCPFITIIKLSLSVVRYLIFYNNPFA